MNQPAAAGDTDLAAVGAVLSDPARARILLALGDGRSLPASMLASEAGVSAPTATHHLSKLVGAGLVAVTPRGRYRYFALAGPRVAELIEAVARVAPAQAVTSLREGTRACALRYARSCYGHLAGRLGVALAEAVTTRRSQAPAKLLVLSPDGASRMTALGVPTEPHGVVGACLDWTEQRHHLGGALGRDLLGRLVDLGWVTRERTSRALRLTDSGREGFPGAFGLRLP